jgi:hypothetical protein
MVANCHESRRTSSTGQIWTDQSYSIADEVDDEVKLEQCMDRVAAGLPFHYLGSLSYVDSSQFSAASHRTCIIFINYYYKRLIDIDVHRAVIVCRHC